MTNPSLAIQKAVEGGWRENTWKNYDYEIKSSCVDCIDRETGAVIERSQFEVLFLDPLFWQALGKTEGWWEKACKFCGEPNQVNGYCRNQHVSEDYSNARFYQHRLIDAIQQGRSINEFFGEILKK